jgi:uncharacterized membrane protein YgdD (TMEM256/DUF423 family)
MHRMVFLIAAIAALQGAAGGALAAVAAHVEQSPLLATASQFLMVHAGAGLALAALSAALRQPSRFLFGLTFVLQGGVALFSLDLALRALHGSKLFPYAAPVGGTMTIAAWAGLAFWASARFARRAG